MNKNLIDWSQKEFQHLPWRKNRTLYGTLVSEIMLQQTTVKTVLGHFERFLKEYPSIQDVAKASEEQLTISWKGLGYYRRCRNLKKACEVICNDFSGKIPLDYNELIAIPGIGDYTANAILSIGNNEPAIALDANLERVLSRLYGIETPKGPKLLKKLQGLFQQQSILKREMKRFGGRALNEALMDLGRNFCMARKAYCDTCPVSKSCTAFKLNRPLEFPVQPIKKEREKHTLELLRVIVRNKERVLVYQKNSQEWLSGQYEVPTFILKSSDSKLNQYEKFSKKIKTISKYKTAITKYSIINHVVELNQSEFESLGFSRKTLWKKKEQNLSTSSTKALASIKGH